MLTVKLAGGSAGPMIDGVGRTTMNSGDVLWQGIAKLTWFRPPLDTKILPDNHPGLVHFPG
jgi:hypothetical protein